MKPEVDSPRPSGQAGAPLVAAAAVVTLGTAVVDPARLWLLLVPASFLVTAYAAGTLVNRTGGDVAAGHDHPPMLALAIRVTVGIACLSLVASDPALRTINCWSRDR